MCCCTLQFLAGEQSVTLPSKPSAPLQSVDGPRRSETKEEDMVGARQENPQEVKKGLSKRATLRTYPMYRTAVAFYLFSYLSITTVRLAP